MDAGAFVALFVVFGILGLLLFALRRGGMLAFRGGFVGSSSGGRELEVIDRLPLTPAHSLHLVRVGDRKLLVSVGPQSCQCIADLDATKSGARQ